MLIFKNTSIYEKNNIIIYTPLSYFADNRQKRYRSIIIITILVSFTFIHRVNHSAMSHFRFVASSGEYKAVLHFLLQVIYFDCDVTEMGTYLIGCDDFC